MKIVYIAHPISGDIEENLKDLARIIREINLTNPHIVPCAPYYADIVAMDDSDPDERARGISNDVELINSGVFKELWLTGNKISFGMSMEVLMFEKLGLPVVDYINKF